MMPLPPHPDLPSWAERHGLDASRVVAPLDVRPAATREHPHQVRVDYVVLLTDGSGRMHRDARTMLTCDPPPVVLAPATGYPWQTVHHDASISVDPHPPEPGIVWLQVDVGDRVHIDLELDPDQAAGLLGDIQRAIATARVDAENREWAELVQAVAPPARATTWCDECSGPADVVDEFDDQVGYEERARDVHVRVLDCGHDIATAIRRATGRCPHVDAPDRCDCAPVIP